MAKKIPNFWFQNEEARKPGLLADEDSVDDCLKKYGEEDNAKLLRLCQHYGIQDGQDMYRELALALARELYPEPKKRGRELKWTPLNMGALVVEVERLVKPDDPSHGVAWACQQLAKRKPWASFLEERESRTSSPDPSEALRRKYYGFYRNKWAEVFRKAFRIHEQEGTIADWEKQVLDFARNPHLK